MYDYNRGRELHIEKALEVVNLNLKGDTENLETIVQDGFKKKVYCNCKHFVLELYIIESKLEGKSDEERFFIYTCVEGSGEIIWKNGISSFVKGESILIPALLGKYEILGKLKVLKSYVPNL